MLVPVLALIAALVSCSPPGMARRPSTSGPASTLLLRETVWDFGTIERGDTVTTSIDIASAGADTLRLKLVPSCDCLWSTPESLVVAPGASASIQLAMVGTDVKEVETKTLFVDSNDPVHPRVALAATGTVTQGRRPHLVVIPDPAPLERAGGATSGDSRTRAGQAQPATAELKLENRGREDLVIEEIRCFGCTCDRTSAVLSSGDQVYLWIEGIPQWSGGRWIEIESNDPVYPLKRVSLVEMD
jgi:hypothetical protein